MRTLALAAMATIALVACHEPTPTEGERSGPGAPEFAAGGSGITVADLGTLPGDVNSYAYGISGTGIVVGYSNPGSNLQARAVRWTSTNGRWASEDLAAHLVGSTRSMASGVNDAGDVVGWMGVSSGEEHAFLLTAAGEAVDLQTTAGSSQAIDINNSGAVVGWISAGSNTVAFYYETPASGVVTLPTLGGNSMARAINDNGIVVGFSFDAPGHSGVQWPVRWTRANGVWTITKIDATSRYSGAVGVNNAGDAVGTGCLTDPGLTNGCPRDHAFLWPAGGGKADLGSLGGASQAYGISEPSPGVGVRIAGYSSNRSGAQQAFVWTATNGMQGLGALAGTWGSQARGINANKQINGFSWCPNVTCPTHATLWTLP